MFQEKNSQSVPDSTGTNDVTEGPISEGAFDEHGGPAQKANPQPQEAAVEPATKKPTLAKIAANRRNAKKSTGPKTLQGKTAVRFNAANLKLGCLAQTLQARFGLAIARGP